MAIQAFHTTLPTGRAVTDLLAAAPARFQLAYADPATHERLEAGEEAPWPAASLIKVPLAVAAYAEAAAGRLDLDEKVRVPLLEADSEREFDNLGLAPAPQSWRKVVDRMLTESDNAATNALIGRLGPDALEAPARAAGLRGTVLARLMLDAEARRAGRENLTTAASLLGWLEALRDNAWALPRPLWRELAGALAQQRDRDKGASALPPGAHFAHKTGELSGYRHDAGLLDGEAAVAVLTAGGDPAAVDAWIGGLVGALAAHARAQRARWKALEAALADRSALGDPRLGHEALRGRWAAGRLLLEGPTTAPGRLEALAPLADDVSGAGAPAWEAAVVVAPASFLRGGPGHAHELVSQVRQGETIALAAGQGDWRLARAADGYVGYLRDGHARPAAPGWAPTHVVSRALAPAQGPHGPVRLSAGTRVQAAPGGYRLAEGTVVGLEATDLRLLAGPAGDVEAVVALAHELLGTPYLWGGATGWGVDCSGLVQLVFGVWGHALPRDADQQEEALPAVPRAALSRGDLVFFPGHVGLYLGEGLVLHASARAGCVIVSSLREGAALYEPWLDEHLTAGGRSPCA